MEVNGQEHGHLVSVNVGLPRAVPWGGRMVWTAIHKAAVSGRVVAGVEGLEGDGQANPSVHGGPDKAIYAYAAEDYRWWEGQLGRELAPGTFGENLTTEGVDVSGAVIGERWEVGGCVFEVAQPREPCGKLAARMGEADFVARFTAAGRPGAYLRVVEGGGVAAGDPVRRRSRPGHGVTVAEMMATGARPTEEGLRRLLGVPEMPANWRRHLERALQRVGDTPGPGRAD